MHALKFIPGAFCGLAVTDGALQLIGNGEADDHESLLITLIPFHDILLDFVLGSLGKFRLFFVILILDFFWSRVISIDDIPDFRLRK